MPVFEAKDVAVSFGAVHAVDGLSLAVDSGEISGLIGPNGAGKTTFVDAVTGYVPMSGSVRINGEPIDSMRPHQRARAGLARTWQNAELFNDLTVVDNVRLVRDQLTPKSLVRGLLRSRAEPVPDRVHAVLDRLEIAEFAASSPGELSVGQQKLVGLARALASDAAVILMDEPAAGLDSHETQSFRRLLRTVADDGVGILLIEHDMDLVLTTCETLHVLNMGCPVASGSTETVRNDPEVVRAYLGDEEIPAGSDPEVTI